MRKPSITYWNRVEPTPRSDSIVRGLEAAVRDPAWFLARQWQIGEFRGEDAGSPSNVSFRATLSRFKSWRTGTQDPQPFAMGAPLEALITAEAMSVNWLVAVELGQMLARLLAVHGASASTIDSFRTAFGVPRPGDVSVDAHADAAVVRFLRICGGRSIDGIAACAAARRSAPAVPPEVDVPPGGETTATENALAAFVAWADKTYGAIGRGDAPAWRPDRLDYDVEVHAQIPSGEVARLRATAGSHGGFDWHAFDEIDRAPADQPQGLEHQAFSLFPTSVSFSGMPSRRWWQFEDARYNWTNVDTDRREIAKAMVLDFMLVQGDDWFILPLGQAVGSLASIDQLLVRDVFGEYTLVERADRERAARRSRWTMFSTAIEDGAGGERLADYFVMAPSALRTTVDGPELEEIRFLRDEQANIVWAVEAKIENGIGRSWQGHERSLSYSQENPAPADVIAPLHYRLQTNVPLHWIPFPPVQIDAARRAVALERASMQRFIDGTLTRIRPVGRVLNPTNVAGVDIYRINEEEVSRSGTRILRAFHRTRWLDGTTQAWISRRRRTGLGEGSSGLRYDIVDQVGTQSE